MSLFPDKFNAHFNQFQIGQTQHIHAISFSVKFIKRAHCDMSRSLFRLFCTAFFSLVFGLSRTKASTFVRNQARAHSSII